MALNVKLNLGSSDDRRDGFISVDRNGPVDVIADLDQVWPWPDSSVDWIYAHDVFEHLASKIHTLNEAHRVLKPGAAVEIYVPCVMLSDGRVNPGAFCDPTHKTFWTMDDHYYFCEQWNDPKNERGRFGESYGITALFRERVWELQEYGSGTERRSKVHAILEAVK